MFDISCISDVLKHLIIYLSNVFGVSNIVNYSIIQLSDISHMSNVLNYLNIVCPLNIGSEYKGKVSRLISMLLYTTDTVIHAHNHPAHLSADM